MMRQLMRSFWVMIPYFQERFNCHIQQNHYGKNGSQQRQMKVIFIW